MCGSGGETRPGLYPLTPRCATPLPLRYAVNWPIGSGDRFRGVYHRPLKEVHIFERGERGKQTKSVTFALDDPKLMDELDDDLYAAL